MAGQSAGKTIATALSEAHSVRERGGISEEETSAIGGEGRRGSDAYGRMEAAPHHCITEEFMSKTGGSASTGQTGPNSGYGKTFGK